MVLVDESPPRRLKRRIQDIDPKWPHITVERLHGERLLIYVHDGKRLFSLVVEADEGYVSVPLREIGALSRE